MRRVPASWWACTLVLAVAFWLRAWRLGEASLWVDEMYTLSWARLPIPALLAHHDQTSPLHALLQHIWIGAAGTSEAALRWPSVLYGTAGVALVYPLARNWTGRVGALCAVAMAASCVWFIRESQDARTYALFLLATNASMLAYLHDAKARTRGSAAWYVAASTLMVYAHTYGLFFLLAQNVHALIERRWAGPARAPWLARQALVAALLAPWATVLAERAAAFGAYTDLWPSQPWLLSHTATAFANTSALRLLALALAGGSAALAWRAGPSAIRKHSLLWLWLAVPVLVPFALGWWRPFYNPRYVLPAAVALWILAAQWPGLVSAWFVESRPARAKPATWVACILLALLVAGMAWTAVAYVRQPHENILGQDWRGASARLERSAGPGELVLAAVGDCDSARMDFQCPVPYYAQRTDLSLVAYPYKEKLDASRVPGLVAAAGNATSFWLLTANYADPPEAERALDAGWDLASDEALGTLRLEHWVR